MAKDISLTGVERTFGEDEIIVSKTDLKGKLIYANHVFVEISGYTEDQIIGKPHNMIRHPDMPRCIFKLLWDTIGDGRELFAYVMNRCKNGDHYWVLAHVTPSFASGGEIIGYHSNRRVPNRDVLDRTIIPLYKKLKAEENSHSSPKDGLEASMKMLLGVVEGSGMPYEEFIFSLGT